LGANRRYREPPGLVKGGYMVNLDKKQLEGAPSYARGSEFKWTPDYGRKVDSLYKVPSAWGV
jgi:hypothetical protein